MHPVKIAQRRRLLLLGSLAGVALVALVGFTYFGHNASASSYYGSGTSGYDISYPQCSTASTSWPVAAFGIVGATGGRAFTSNSCLGTEFAWAGSGTPGAAPSLYMNLNYPVGSTASNGKTGPAGTCSKSNSVCYAYNYGYNAASYAFGLGASSTMWWLDIETGNSWSKTNSLNDQVIEGAVDYIQTHGATAGVYSTASMWRTIAGSSFVPGATPGPGGLTSPLVVAANWVPGSSSLCGNAGAALYSSGAVWLAQSTVQVNGATYDADYAC
jgi:hypothetical protein